MTEVLTRTIALACPPDRAFAAFTAHTDLWWPRAHRRTREAPMVLEPRSGGRLLERTPDGDEWVLGKLTRFEPPAALSFDWFPGSPAAPTSVDISFAEAGNGTEIRIVHQALANAAMAAWPDKVALFARGWDTVLPALRDFTDREN